MKNKKNNLGMSSNKIQLCYFVAKENLQPVKDQVFLLIK
jgi:hypothetical protein